MVVIGEASDGPEGRLAHTHQPEVAILDIAMPHLNGSRDGQTAAGGSAPDQDHRAYYAHGRALRLRGSVAGGGYVLKTQAAVDIVQAIHTVLQGAIYLSARVTNAVVQAYLISAALPRTR